MDAYTHIQDLELGYFEDQSTGGLMSVLNDDVNQLERFLDVGAPAIIGTVVNVILVGIIFVIASPLLALVAFAPIPVILWGSFLYQRKLEPQYREVRDQGGPPLGHPRQQPGRHRAPSRPSPPRPARSRAWAASRRRYREANQRRHPPLLGLRPAHPRGDPDRLHDDPAHRRQDGDRRHPQRGLLLGAGVHDPAPPVAAHPPGRDLRPLPARHGVSTRGSSACWTCSPPSSRAPARCPSRWPARCASTTCASPTTPAPRCCTASTSTSPPARPTPSSASPGRASPRS